VTRLEEVFQIMDQTAKTVQCPAIDGILKEANEIAGDVEDKDVLDAALIMAAQAVEHYEITRYGTLSAWARLLGHPGVAKLFDANLKEEKATDKKLNVMAKRKINKKALARQKKRRPDEIQRAENAFLSAAAGVPALG
jgi:ferritin-like metal-binding protein YciE